MQKHLFCAPNALGETHWPGFHCTNTKNYGSSHSSKHELPFFAPKTRWSIFVALSPNKATPHFSLSQILFWLLKIKKPLTCHTQLHASFAFDRSYPAATLCLIKNTTDMNAVKNSATGTEIHIPLTPII